MVKVKKANVILDIAEDTVEAYRKKGYCVIDEDGNIKYNAHPVTFEEYKALLTAKTDELESAHAELDKARETIKELKNKLKESGTDDTAKETKK